MFIRRTDVYFDILETIMPEDFTDSTAELGERIYNLMLENINKRKQQ